MADFWRILHEYGCRRYTRPVMEADSDKRDSINNIEDFISGRWPH